MLRLQKLSKTYKTGDQALTAIDLDVPKGQVLALIGPSGAGKSTLIRCINRLVEPTSGSVKLGGEEITTLNRRELRKARTRMGMIFQEYNLVERLTVMENVLSKAVSAKFSISTKVVAPFPRTLNLMRNNSATVPGLNNGKDALGIINSLTPNT